VNFSTSLVWATERWLEPDLYKIYKIKKWLISRNQILEERVVEIIRKRRDYKSKNRDQVYRFGPYQATYIHESARLAFEENEYETSEGLAVINKRINGIDVNPSCNIGATYGFGHCMNIVIGGIGNCGDMNFYSHSITIGRYEEKRPILGNKIVIMPGAVIAGNSVIGDNVTISSGTVIINLTIPSGVLVYRCKEDGVIKYKSAKKDYWESYFTN